MANIELLTAHIRHPKIAALSNGAYRIWIAGLCYSKEHLTDGKLLKAWLPSLGVKVTSTLVRELTQSAIPGKAPLWESIDGGYLIHDYLDWQDSADTVKRGRDALRERVKRHRQRQWHADSNGVTETQGNAVTHPVSNDGSYYQLRTTTEQIPDPSEDPTSEKGRTPSARARPGPLIARRKGWCAWEGAALSVHSRLHEEFRGRLELAGMDRETADRELFGWYGATEDAWRGQDIGEDLFEFWRKRFKEWRGTTPTKSNEELARERRRTELQARITGQEAAKR